MHLLHSGTAPAALRQFAVVAPHSPRGWMRESATNIVRLVDFLVRHSAGAEPESGVPRFDVRRMHITGFSDGATAALRAAVNGRFAACLSVSCGVSRGVVEHLHGVPVWLVHAANDVMLPVECSDGAFATLRDLNGEGGYAGVKYTRHERAPDDSGKAEGHCTPCLVYGEEEYYAWLREKALDTSEVGRVGG